MGTRRSHMPGAPQEGAAPELSKKAKKKLARLEKARQSKATGGFGGWKKRNQNTQKRDEQGSVNTAEPSELHCHEGLSEIGAGEFMGQDKWLGGACGSDGCIYGMPGTSKHVLKIDPTTGESSLIGGPYEGRFKWLRGGVVGDEVFGVPSNADTVPRIRPKEGTVDTIGGPYPGKWKWHGGVVSPDGNLYGIPANAEQVLKVIPSTGEVSLVGPCFPGDQKWHGGVVGRDGCIYGIPSHSDYVLKVDPMAGEVGMIGEKLEVPVTIRDGRYKYLGGVLGSDGMIYAMPANAESVLQIDVANQTTRLVGGPFVGENKWQNGYLCPDGCVYGIPLRAESVLKIEPLASGEVVASTIGGPLVGTDKWEGGVEGPDGALYCIPLRCKSVLKIAPHLQEQSAGTNTSAATHATQEAQPPAQPTRIQGDLFVDEINARLDQLEQSRGAPVASNHEFMPSAAFYGAAASVVPGLGYRHPGFLGRGASGFAFGSGYGFR